jgi:hypothetical protein
MFPQRKRQLSASVLVAGVGLLFLVEGRAIAQAPVVVPPKPPQLRESPMSIPLPSPVGNFVVGGLGRYLLLHLPKPNTLAVFDVEQMRVVKRLTFADDNFLFAAGATRFVVYDPTTKRFTRYRFDTFASDGESPPILEKIANIAMGSSSEGPIGAVVYPQDRNDGSQHDGVDFFDLKTFKMIPSLDKKEIVAFRKPATLRASPDGTLFAGWDRSSSSGLYIYRLSAKGFRTLHENGDLGATTPGGDDRIYTAGGVFNSDGKPLIRTEIAMRQARVPAVDGPYSLLIKEVDYRDKGPWLGPTRTSVCRNGGLETVADLEQQLNVAWETFTVYGREGFPIDRRVALIPSAELLITFPKNRDFIELRHLKLPTPP